MNIDDHLVFNQHFFQHALEYKPNSRALSLLTKLFQKKAFTLPLMVFEKAITFILNLRIPIYSDIVLSLVSNLPGLPKMLGCYIRGLYYKGALQKLEPNVLIEQGATFSNPHNVQLSEFSFIDKYVIIAAEKATIGRRVHIAPFVIITGGGEFIIEDYACMATGSRAITATESLKPNTRSSGPMVSQSQRDVIKGKVHIKKDAFIAVGVTILTNSTVDEGAVLAANVVHSGNTEEWKYYVTKDSQQKPIRTQAFKRRKKLDLPDA